MPNAFTPVCFYTPIRLHSYRVLLQTKSFTQRFFYTQTLLHSDAFDTQWQVRLHANAFTGWCVFHTLVFSHTHALSQIAFNHTRFYIEIFLHRDTFTQRWVYTGMLSHTETLLHTSTFTQSFFLHWATLHTYAKNKQRCFYKGLHWHKELLPTDVFTQTYFYMIPDGRHAFGAKGFSKHATSQFHPQLLTIETHFVGEGWHGTNPHCNLISMYDDRRFVRVAFRGHQSTLPWRPTRKFRKHVVGAF